MPFPAYKRPLRPLPLLTPLSTPSPDSTRGAPKRSPPSASQAWSPMVITAKVTGKCSSPHQLPTSLFLFQQHPAPASPNLTVSPPRVAGGQCHHHGMGGPAEKKSREKQLRPRRAPPCCLCTTAGRHRPALPSPANPPPSGKPPGRSPFLFRPLRASQVARRETTSSSRASRACMATWPRWPMRPGPPGPLLPLLSFFFFPTLTGKPTWAGPLRTPLHGPGFSRPHLKFE
jgi:hypothetical protein